MRRHAPPRLAEWLLRFVLSGQDRDQQLGDLAEEFAALAEQSGRAAAGRWYWRQLIGSVVPSWQRRRDTRARRAARAHPSRNRGNVVETIGQDVRYGWRTFRRQPGFFVVAVLTLALGIGANTTIYAVADAVLFRTLPFPEADRLAILWSTFPDRGRERGRVSGLDYHDWRATSETFDDLAILGGSSFTLTAEGFDAELLDAYRISANYFQVLGIPPVLGRVFTAAENEQGASNVVLLSHELWRSRFNADSTIVGQRVRLDESLYTVVGVMPAGAYPLDIPAGGSRLRLSYDPRTVWVPAVFGSQCIGNRRCRVHGVVGRLAAGASWEGAQSEFRAIARRLADAYPGTNSGLEIAVVPLHEEVTGGQRPALLVLLGAVGVVLLMACANLANLFLVRSLDRRGEIALRAALGAGRGRLLRQFLTEAMMVAVVGGLLGVAVARAGVAALLSLHQSGFARHEEIGVHLSSIWFTVALTLVVGLLVGVVPSLRLSGTRARDTVAAAGRRLTHDKTGRRWGQGLVVVQMAMAVVLVVGAALLAKSFWRLMQTDLGFQSEGVVLTTVVFPNPRFSQAGQVSARAYEVLERVRAVPGVRLASLTYDHPLRATWGQSFLVEGRPPVPPEQALGARYRPVGPDYFRTMGIPLLAGREFTERDRADSPGVVVVNETLVRQVFPGEDPLGQRLRINAGTMMWGPGLPESFEIVGIARDVRFQGHERDSEPATYVPFAQGPYAVAQVVVKADASLDAVSGAVVAAIRDTDPNLPITSIETMRRLEARALGDRRFTLVVLAAFGMAALAIAAIGVFGVVSSTVASRAREFGVRIALGARPTRVVQAVVGRSAILIGIGIGSGLVVAALATRLLESMLFGVTASDPMMFTLAAATIAISAGVACALPAVRAARLDPMRVLRTE